MEMTQRGNFSPGRGAVHSGRSSSTMDGGSDKYSKTPATRRRKLSAVLVLVTLLVGVLLWRWAANHRSDDYPPPSSSHQHTVHRGGMGDNGERQGHASRANPDNDATKIQRGDSEGMADVRDGQDDTFVLSMPTIGVGSGAGQGS